MICPVVGIFVKESREILEISGVGRVYSYRTIFCTYEQNAVFVREYEVAPKTVSI